jgi:hypothetical protein
MMLIGDVLLIFSDVPVPARVAIFAPLANYLLAMSVV